MLPLALIAAFLLPPWPTTVEFEGQVRASAAAAQALQGPLDGAWIVAGAGGEAIYQIELTDPVGGRSLLAGAWRDPRRPPGSEQFGAVDILARTADRLSLSFTPVGASPVTIRLRRRDVCRWAGILIESGVREPVRMLRDRAPTAEATACVTAPAARRFP